MLDLFCADYHKLQCKSIESDSCCLTMASVIGVGGTNPFDRLTNNPESWSSQTLWRAHLVKESGESESWIIAIELIT